MSIRGKFPQQRPTLNLDFANSKTLEDVEQTYYAVRGQIGDIDIIGDIWNDDGVYSDPETGEMTVITPPTKMEGYHVNIILEGALPETLQEFVVEPSLPKYL